MSRSPFIDVTDVDFSDSMLQTRDLDLARDEFRRRAEQSGICAHCDLGIEEVRTGWTTAPEWRHSDGRQLTCANGEELAEPAEEPLDDDEAETFALLDDLNEQLGNDLHSPRSLINDDYWETYIRDQATENGVPSFIEPYVDWANYADSLRADWSIIELGRYTYLYQD